ncbi:tetraacyldisaccharide 4'-kinase [Campylobacter geochelonis]|uniref:Tetraacyldisaccharide 4'-kinase n=1 Tax=Campylobacter geochelonis TaxID=1780362 RepID=A0A128EN64_9BACT|nr:tetraacyldisaccharide 4'-kinase [Campylobacter geochelonis]CZE47251.1 tetraacyldisaccharide 4'-kinase [Campylobacter geochelonis]CZE50114.1 tetraacyldisaccharide 4'-kinase [Campylobacter geochelonis]
MFERKFHAWIDRYFYTPSFSQKLLAQILAPLSILYALVVTVKKRFSKEVDYKIPIISVGNLTLGGSGKTPLTKAIFLKFSPKFKTFIILRGYKRNSRGMHIVALDGKILVDIKTSGDEAMEYALGLQNANVIVSEDRVIAIKEAKKLGAKLILLDDGFSKFNIKKFNILLVPKPKPALNLTLPSGAYRYPLSFYKFGDFIPKQSDIKKTSTIKNPTKRMVLTTAIAKPNRLKEHFSSCVGKEFFPDHYEFKKDELEEILKRYNATSLLVTAKDYVKIKDFNLPLSLINLELELSSEFEKKISSFIK